jgi:hypothetical protein
MIDYPRRSSYKERRGKLRMRRIKEVSLMNGYIAIYKGKRVEVYADSLLAARTKAAEMLKVKPAKHYQIAIMLAEKNGKPVTHLPLF